MKSTSPVIKRIREADLTVNPRRDAEILDEISQVAQFRYMDFPQEPARKVPMYDSLGKFATATVVIGAMALYLIVESLNSQAWAMDDAIEALTHFSSVHIVGALGGNATELWMRSNQGEARQSSDVLMRTGGDVMWNRDGSTYHYVAGNHTVYYEQAVTLGVAQWLGPELLETLSKVDDAQILHGMDAETGRDRVTFMGSMVDTNGPQSWVIEFDAETRLPVTMQQWQNLDRIGPPGFDAFRIVYYEELPDSMFDVQIPGEPRYVEKELSIPESTIAALGNPADGIPATGMAIPESAAAAVRAMYTAVIEEDLDSLKRICPLCRNWGDELLRAMIVKPGQDDRMVEILEIGDIVKTGRSIVGTIVAVPTRYRLANGKAVTQKMIVQFRQFGEDTSCVVFGPWGLPHERQD